MSCVIVDAWRVEGGASQSTFGPQDHGTDRERRPLDLLHQALSPAARGSGRRRHLLSPHRWRSIQERPVVDLVSEHDVEPDEELPRDRHFRARAAPSMEHGVIETFEIRIALDRRLARLAEQVPEEGVPSLRGQVPTKPGQVHRSIAHIPRTPDPHTGLLEHRIETTAAVVSILIGCTAVAGCVQQLRRSATTMGSRSVCQPDRPEQTRASGGRHGPPKPPPTAARAERPP